MLMGMLEDFDQFRRVFHTACHAHLKALLYVMADVAVPRQELGQPLVDQ